MKTFEKSRKTKLDHFFLSFKKFHHTIRVLSFQVKPYLPHIEQLTHLRLHSIRHKSEDVVRPHAYTVPSLKAIKPLTNQLYAFVPDPVGARHCWARRYPDVKRGNDVGKPAVSEKHDISSRTETKATSKGLRIPNDNQDGKMDVIAGRAQGGAPDAALMLPLCLNLSSQG